MPSRHRLAHVAATAGALLVAACVTQTTSTFSIAPGGARLTMTQAREQLGAIVGGECPRLQREARPPAATARVTVALDSAGAVTSAALDEPLGDARLDAMAGSVVAALQLEPPPAGGERARLRVGYACADSAATASVERLP